MVVEPGGHRAQRIGSLPPIPDSAVISAEVPSPLLW